jgi:putative ABC transport system permease protein
MNILRKFTQSSLAKNKKRTIVTVIAIVLTAAMLTGVTTLVSSFKDMFVRQTIAVDGDYHIKYSAVPFDKTSYIAQHSLVYKAFMSIDLGYTELNIDRPVQSFLKVAAYDENALEMLPVNLVEGRKPESSREILLDVSLMNLSGMEVGDEIVLSIGSKAYSEEEQTTFIDFQSSKDWSFTIVGFINRIPYETGYSSDMVALTFLDNNITGEFGETNMGVLLNKPKDPLVKAEQIAKDVNLPKTQSFYGDYSYTFNSDLLMWQGASVNQRFIYFQETAAVIIMLLIVVGAVIVIYNSFAISISERKKQYGMLRSVGATAKQIKRTVYWESFLLSIVGVPLGVLGGIFGIFVTLKFADRIIQDIVMGSEHIYLVVSPLSIIVAVLFVIVTIFISTVIPAKKAAKISPIDAIRLSTDINTKKKSRSNPITKFIFGIEGDIALKNLKRNRKRYFATIISLFISIVLFVSFNSFVMYTLDVSQSYMSTLGYDLSVNIYNNEIDSNEISDYVSNLNEVEEVVKVITTNLLLEVDQSYFTDYTKQHLADFYDNAERREDTLVIGAIVVSLDDYSYRKYINDHGYDNNDGLLYVSEHNVRREVMHIFDMFNFPKGAELTFRGFLQESDSISAQLPVFGEVKESPKGIQTPSSQPIFVVNSGVYEEYFRELGGHFYEYIYINTSNPDSVEEQINEKYIENGSRNMHVYNAARYEHSDRQMILLISIFVYGFITLITLIGITNIFNTISTNVELRRREFAMLRSVGLTKKGFKKILNYECVFYGIVALVFGLPASVLVSYWMFGAFGYIGSFNFTMSVNSIIACIIGVFSVIFITMIYSSKRLENDNIVEAIRDENI